MGSCMNYCDALKSSHHYLYSAFNNANCQSSLHQLFKKKRSVFYYTQLCCCFLLTVSNDALRGSTPQASAQVLQWVSFADSEIIPPASAWVFPTLGIMQFNKQVSFEYICVMVSSVRNWMFFVSLHSCLLCRLQNSLRKRWNASSPSSIST